MPVYYLQGKYNEKYSEALCDVPLHGAEYEGTWIKKGDKIGQFRIMEVMPEIEFDEWNQ